MIDFFRWGNPIEIERRRRILLCLWAYAYEIENAPLVSDERFDEVARQSDTTVETGRFDDWWHTEFKPDTGMWIRSHPDLQGVQTLYNRLR